MLSYFCAVNDMIDPKEMEVYKLFEKEFRIILLKKFSEVHTRTQTEN